MFCFYGKKGFKEKSLLKVCLSCHFPSFKLIGGTVRTKHWFTMCFDSIFLYTHCKKMLCNETSSHGIMYNIIDLIVYA